MTPAEVACEHGENERTPRPLVSRQLAFASRHLFRRLARHPKQFRTCDHDSQALWRGEYISKKLAPAACGAGVVDELALSLAGRCSSLRWRTRQPGVRASAVRSSPLVSLGVTA